jgi:CRP-like cAMP-binding protein
MHQILINSPLFKGYHAEEIGDMLKITPYQFKSFLDGEIIAFSGDRVERAMLLLEGRLQGEMLDFSGNRLRIEELEPPQMVAAAFLYGPQNFFPVNLTALSAGKILVIYRNDFTIMLTRNSRMLQNYLSIISGKAQFLSQKITFLSYKTIKEKIAYFLLQRLRKEERYLQLELTQTQLASQMGVARPSLSRTISEMEAEKLLQWKKNEVVVLDFDRLNKILGRNL